MEGRSVTTNSGLTFREKSSFWSDLSFLGSAGVDDMVVGVAQAGEFEG